MLLDRDFLVPTRNLLSSLKPTTNPVYVLEYDAENPIAKCLQLRTHQFMAAFCSRVWNYFTRYAIHG